MKLDETTQNKFLVQHITFEQETKRLQAELTAFTQRKEQEFANVQKMHNTIMQNLVKEYCEANGLNIETTKIEYLTGEVTDANGTGTQESN